MYFPQLSQLRILLFAKNNAQLDELEGLLSGFKFQNLYSTVNAVECFELLSSKNIQLIICLDNELSGDDLWEEIFSGIRGSEKTFKLPIIMISERVDPEKIRNAIASGITEYIVPPFTQEILTERIENAIRLPIRNNSHYFIDSRSQTNIKKKNKNELTLLVVDDITENIELVRGIVQGSYNLKAAKSAQMAMKICLSNSPPDLILLDIMMPETDGLTFCKMLKHNPLTQNIAVIFVTAVTGSNDMIKGLELGAVDYITKPINPELFLARINMHAKLILDQYKLKEKIKTLENASKHSFQK